jgi:hypothetical protein
MEFRARDSIARFLTRYDACAWRTTDVLIAAVHGNTAGLGPVWFCFRLDDRWHAVYGRFDTLSDRYVIAYHYQWRDTLIEESRAPLDSARISDYARAIHTASAKAPGVVGRSGIRWNVYVLNQPDSTLVVWWLPAVQEDGTVLFGAMANLTMDARGRAVLDSLVDHGPIRGMRPDTSIIFRVDSNSPDVPTVGDLFFYYSVRSQFKSVRIVTPKWSSSIIKGSAEEAWVHIELKH